MRVCVMSVCVSVCVGVCEGVCLWGGGGVGGRRGGGEGGEGWEGVSVKVMHVIQETDPPI